ncbi:ParB/RepB/Spo0J family partition protein [Kitasatospora sp. NPDC059088]|uniref:ParB/RepB/Spo0J family partition protein n=1 Tax=Kitasatospora sp. NPDC059088 TaxID=3346722 RepID=UPI00367D7E6D
MSARTKSKTPARPATGMIVRNFRFMEVDPRTLVLDPCNVRTEEKLPTQEMLDSVAQDGVDTPVIVRPLTPEQIEKLTEEGKPAPEFGVLAGQQRWLSSKEAVKKAEEDHTSWLALPIVVRDDLKGADKEAITRSLVENTHRKAMTKRDEAQAAAQLAAFSMTPTQRKKAARSIGLTDAQFAAAKGAVALDAKTFDEAAECDFDLVQTTQYGTVEHLRGASRRLKEAAAKDAAEGGGYGHWDHAIASLLQEEETARLRKERLAALRADGVPEVDRPYEWRGDKMRLLTDLMSGMGNPVDPEHHVKDCPGRAFFNEYGEAVLVCADWKKNGHQLSKKAAEKSGGPATAEESRAAVRLIRSNNEAFKAATTVRRAALKAALKEKPSGASWALVRRIVCDMPGWYAKFVTSPNRRLMAQLLGAPESVTRESGKKEDDEDRITVWLEQAESRMGEASSGKLILAQIFAAFEARVMNANKVWEKPGAAVVQLLVFMRDHLAYKLSEIEAAMVALVEGSGGEPDASAAQAQLTGQADQESAGGTEAADELSVEVESAVGTEVDGVEPLAAESAAEVEPEASKEQPAEMDEAAREADVALAA